MTGDRKSLIPDALIVLSPAFERLSLPLSLFPRRGVTGWCRGCPPSSCYRLPRHSRRFQRKGVSASPPSPAAWMVRTLTCFRWGQIAGGAPRSPTEGTAEREGGTYKFCPFLLPVQTNIPPIVSFLPAGVCSFLWRTSLLRSSHPSPGVHGRNISAFYDGRETRFKKRENKIKIKVLYRNTYMKGVTKLQTCYRLVTVLQT